MSSDYDYDSRHTRFDEKMKGVKTNYDIDDAPVAPQARIGHEAMSDISSESASLGGVDCDESNGDIWWMHLGSYKH